MVDDLIVRAVLEGRSPPYAFDRDVAARISSRKQPQGGVAITLRGLSKAFASHSVLRAIDLHVPAGQFLTIVGRSGCGKSTLLRILAGLDHSTSGRTLFDGREPADSKHVGRLMFQEPRLLPWASVLANVEVGLGRNRTAPGGGAHARDMLTEVGLRARAADWPSVLSGGQKQRVALARALAGRPQFLALDEPLGALDALTRMEMQGLLESVWLEQGFTAILVTHDVGEAISLGDRVLLIQDGIVSLDVDVPLERPRRRGSPQMAKLERRVLDHLLANSWTAGETGP